MSRLRIFREDDPEHPLLSTALASEIAAELQKIGVRFEQWQAGAELPAGAAPDVVLDAYRYDIERLVAEKGFRTVDVVSIAPDDPERETKRSKFLAEHYHNEDEVRFFVDGSGLFTLHVGEKVYEIRCERGDLIGVPDSTLHWFDMGAEPRFIAIRFFTEPDGWIGHFTGNDLAQRFPRHEPDAAA